MPRKSTKPSTRRDLYAEVTEAIASAMEAGCAPWVKPWRSLGGTGWPANAATGKAYRGINVWLLLTAAQAKGYTDTRWVTFKQARGLGGSVRRGEKSTVVVFWKVLLKDADGNTVSPADADGSEEKVWMLRHYNVFNVEQCDGLELDGPELAEAPEPAGLDNPAAQAVMDALVADGCQVGHGGNRACYNIAADAIKLPKPEAFEDAGSYWSTALHEATHATGAPKRNDRTFGKRFGDDAYAFEELVAELGSAYLCAATEVDGQLQHPEYLAHWAQVLRQDTRAIFTAAKQAALAADWLLDRAGLQAEPEAPASETEAA